MASVRFGDVSADMRRVEGNFDIAELSALENFAENFVAVREEVLEETPTRSVVRLYDAAGSFLTITAQGDFNLGLVNYLSLQGRGLILEIQGSLSLNAAGDISGISRWNVLYTADDRIVLDVAGVNATLGSIETFPHFPGAMQLSGPDVISAGAGDDYLLGYAGADSISGGGGNDTLDGGEGADMLSGGAGDDLYRVDNVLDQVVESPAQGSDTVRSGVTYALRDGFEHLTLLGPGDIDGYGNGLANGIFGNRGDNALRGDIGADTLEGGAGNDTLTGGPGADSLAGGAGDDLYSIDVSDVLVDAGGVDTVRTAFSYELLPDFENLELVGNTAIEGTGNARANTIRGNAEDNLIEGRGSNDFLIGVRGNDTLIGGGGSDSLLASGGSDSLSGGRGDDTLDGGAGSDVLDGGAGFDRMTGGSGDDTYVVNGSLLPYVLIMDGEPGDYISGGQSHFYTSATGTFAVNAIWDRTADGLPDFVRLSYTEDDYAHWWYLDFGTDGLGENLASGYYPHAQRASFADAGYAGLDVYGDGRGSNEVYGSFTIHEVEFDYSGESPELVSFSASFEHHSEGPTSPALTGIINYNHASAEPVVELPNGGIDTVNSVISYELPANVENLILSGVKAIDGTGNSAANAVTGNAASNVLIGLGGADTLDGGGSPDTLLGGVGADLLTGGSGPDSLEGGADADILAGGMGRDTLSGDAGSDAYVFDAALDASTNVDRIIGFNAANDAVHLDADIFGGIAIGTLHEAAFQGGAGLTAAQDTNDRIVYDTSSGQLYYDGDGAGGAAATLFAILDGVPAIGAADFFIVA